MPLLKRRSPSLRERWRVELADFVAALVLDGGLAFVGTGEGDVVPVALESGTVGPLIATHRHGVMALAAHAGVVASAGADGVVLTDRTQAAACAHREIAACVPTPAGLAFTPDGALLAIADRRRILVVDRSGELRHVLEPHASTVEALAYAADGRTLAVAAYGGLRLWSIEAGEPAAKDLAWKGSLLQTAWRPNATVIASGTQDGAVHFWRLDRGSDAAMHGFPAKPKAIVWDSRGRVLATSGGGLVCTWDFTTGPEGQRPTILSGHDDVPCDVMAFKPLEATLAGGTRAGRVLLWSPLRSPEPLAGAEVGAEVTALAWSPSELLIVTTRTGTVVAYELSR